MKTVPTYQYLFTVAGVCLIIQLLIMVGIIGFFLKAIGILAFIWGVVKYYQQNKTIKGKGNKR